MSGATLCTEGPGIGFYMHEDGTATQTCGERLSNEEWARLHRAGLLPSRRAPLRIVQIASEAPTRLEHGGGLLVPAGQPYLVQGPRRYTVTLNNGKVRHVSARRFEAIRSAMLRRLGFAELDHPGPVFAPA